MSRRLHRTLAVVAAMLGSLALAPAIAHAVPTITTQASPDIPMGGQLTDHATLTGGAANPTGTVTFRLYANDPTCSGVPVFPFTISLTNTGPTSGTATSAAFTPTSPGVYRWIASYSGDSNNAAATGVCDDPAETRSVGQETPVLTTSATGDTQRGGRLGDSAKVSGGSNPTGSVTFRLYGPRDPNCTAAPVFTSTNVLNSANADPTLVVSDTYVPTVAGVYRWIATYDGNALNRAVRNFCGDPSQTRTVFGESMTTTATAGMPLGAGQLFDRATVTNLFMATTAGAVTFRLYGPDDANCSGTPVFVNIQPLTLIGVPPIGIAQSAGYTPTTVGVYRWVASYSGDANNAALTGACNDADETSTVAPKLPPTAIERKTCAGRTATIVAVAGRWVITGTARNDVIVGSAADETINGRGGNDVICAGTGDDTVRGGAGTDAIRGDSGSDQLYGDSGSDLVVGGGGADRLFGGSGRDRLRAAGGGADRLDCGTGPGRDDASLDRRDRQRRCEIRRRQL